MKTAICGVLLAALMLGGCARFAYQPAADADAASVTFSSEGISVQPMVCVPGKGFRATEYSVASNEGDSDFTAELNETLKKQPEVTTQLPGGRDARVAFSYSQASQSAGIRDRCKVAVFFHARAGAHYQAHFSLPGGQCALTLTSNDDPALEAVVVPFSCP